MNTLISYLLAVLIAGASAATVTGYAVHHMDQTKYDELVIANQAAVNKAVTEAANKQNAIDRQNVVAAVTEEKAQVQIRTVTRIIRETIHDNVTPAQDRAISAGVGCITFGFVRVLVAAERGVPADSLDIPAGESVDACAADTLSDVATQLTEAFSVARQNAEQLNALIASVEANVSVEGTNEGDTKVNAARNSDSQRVSTTESGCPG